MRNTPPKSKALSLWQPWATLIAVGAKEYETRSWTTDYRGSLVIHAAKRWTAEQVMAKERLAFAYLAVRQIHEWPLGMALCVVDLVAIIPTTLIADQISHQERALGDFSRGRYAWQLANVRRFEKPIPARGEQGLWDWTGPV